MGERCASIHRRTTPHEITKQTVSRRQWLRHAWTVALGNWRRIQFGIWHPFMRCTNNECSICLCIRIRICRKTSAHCSCDERCTGLQVGSESRAVRSLNCSLWATLYSSTSSSSNTANRSSFDAQYTTRQRWTTGATTTISLTSISQLHGGRCGACVGDIRRVPTKLCKIHKVPLGILCRRNGSQKLKWWGYQMVEKVLR